MIPYENYVGAILGDHFQLGRLIRQDLDGDVYSANSLKSVTQNLEAKAYSFNGLSRRDLDFRKKSMNQLPGRFCSIDQAGRKFIVYQNDKSPQNFSLEKARKIENRAVRLEPAINQGMIPSQLGFPNRQCNAANEFNATEVETQVHTLPVSAQESSIVPHLEEESPTGNIKHKKRQRGLKKIKIAHFRSLETFDQFLFNFSMRLSNRRRRLDMIQPGAIHYGEFLKSKEGRMTKQIAVMQKQYEDLIRLRPHYVLSRQKSDATKMSKQTTAM